ncbi:MAG: hypothetical protein RLZZ469_1642 [Bacteroidota bacterium]|jgi:hypothetical protein
MITSAEQYLLSQLEALGISFSVTNGGVYQIEPENINEYLKDPDSFIANINGVSKENFIACRDSVPIQCSANTAKKRRCKHNVVGWAHYLSYKEYESLVGGYCASHGGGK